MIEISEKKEFAGFSLDKEVNDFFEKKKWELKKSKSQLVNTALKYFKEHENQLEKIVEEED